MGLVADDAVDDVSTGLLELARELDVRGFVEARPQLDQHRDFLARLRGATETLDERRVRRRPI